MGGGSGGGGSGPSISVEQLTRAANERIARALKERRHTLFVCHSRDADELRERIARSAAFVGVAHEICTEVDGDDVPLESAGLVICYVSRSTEFDHLNATIRRCVELKRYTVFVRGHELAGIPNYVDQFRIRTLNWSQLQEIILS